MVTKTQLYGVASGLVFIGIVIACLWPFHSPRNQVAWLPLGNGVRLGGYGTIISRDAIMPSDRPGPSAWTLEIWLWPWNPYRSGTILAFYDARRSGGLLLRQWNTDLLVESGVWSREPDDDAPEFGAESVFHDGHAVFLTLVSGPQGTNLYANGNLVRTASELRPSSDELSGRLVVANSPVDTDSWSGELRGLAVYSRELNQAQVFRHFATWTRTGRPEVRKDESPVALYLFSEGSGNVIHNQAGRGADLYIPERYLEIHQSFLKRPWNEYRPTWDYWANVLVNIAGFVPLGFLLYGYLSLALRIRRGALITILVGALLSLTVETLQAFLPTRDSGMTDIVTNTLGTAVGVALCHYASVVCESISGSRHVQVRRLAALLTRREQAERMTVPKRVCSNS